MNRLAFLSSVLFLSVKSWAIAVPQNCDRLWKGSDYFLDGYVESISEEKNCLTSNCSSFEIYHTAKFRVNESIKGDIASGTIIDIKYESVIRSSNDDFGPDFQGHSPKPKVFENWKVFVDRYGNDTFMVAPPNGWWPSENVSCWLDTLPKPILERREHRTYAFIDQPDTFRRLVTIYSDGSVYLKQESDFFPGKTWLIGTLSPEVLSSVEYTVSSIEPSANNTFSTNPNCLQSGFIEYRVLKYDFQFKSIQFAQSDSCGEGYIENDDDSDLNKLKKILDGFSNFFQD
jgi:hypothetical protein